MNEKEKLVDLYARTLDGQWVKISADIPEEKAQAVWLAGFRTGRNIFSIEDEAGRRIMEENKK